MDERLTPPENSALILVDVQNDFCPGGALAVPDGDLIVPALNRAIQTFGNGERPIIASRDWHPRQTSHFADRGGPWPPHCVAGEPGAEFHRKLRLPTDTIVLSKGTGADEDAYSAFQGRDQEGRSIEDVLRANNVSELYVGGLATDYCVRATVLDALQAGYRVNVIKNGVRGVDVKPGDSERALAEMQQAGAHLITL